jgi:excisionase family DNA binding protein
MPAPIPTLDEIRAAVREELERFRAELGGRAAGVLSTEQAAEIAGVSAKTIREWISDEKIPAGRRGQRRTILRADLERYLAGRREDDARSPDELADGPRRRTA